MNIKNNKNCKITINNEEIVVSQKEKTADEMFEELGYSILDGIENFYTNVLIAGKKQKDISFDDIAKDFITISLTKYNEYGNLETNQIVLSVKELQAINKKCKELRLAMINKCKYITIRTKNYEKYFYCRLNKKIIIILLNV